MLSDDDNCFDFRSFHYSKIFDLSISIISSILERCEQATLNPKNLIQLQMNIPLVDLGQIQIVIDQ